MLQIRRKAHKNKLRRQQIDNFFSLKRSELVSEPNTIFKKICNEMVSENEYKLEMINKLIYLCQEHEQNENTYVLIGNYLIDYNEAMNDFFERIVSHPVLCSHYVWVLRIMLDNMIDCCKGQHSVKSEQLIQCQEIKYFTNKCYKIYAALHEVILLLLKEISTLTNRQESNGISHIYQQFLCIFQQILTYCTYEQFPYQLLDVYNQLIHKLQTQQDFSKKKNSDEKHMICQITMLMLKHLPSLQSYQCLQHCFMKMTDPIHYILEQEVKEREECIELLIKGFGVHQYYTVYFLNVKVIRVLFQLLDQVNHLKEPICKLFKAIISSLTSVDCLFSIINQGLHIKVAQLFAKAVEINYDCWIQSSLECIYWIFKKLSDFEEHKMLRRIIYQVEQTANFSNKVDLLLHQDNQTTLNDILGLIIDDFYSEEVQI